jgi:hypothetical protein
MEKEMKWKGIEIDRLPDVGAYEVHEFRKGHNKPYKIPVIYNCRLQARPGPGMNGVGRVHVYRVAHLNQYTFHSDKLWRVHAKMTWVRR